MFGNFQNNKEIREEKRHGQEEGEKVNEGKEGRRKDKIKKRTGREELETEGIDDIIKEII
jgi:hypothetical protein